MCTKNHGTIGAYTLKIGSTETMTKPTLTPQEFVDKWRNAELKERSAAQEHFIDLCRMLNHPSRAEADPEGTWFTFEPRAAKQRGGQGWADVWKKKPLRLGVQKDACTFRMKTGAEESDCRDKVFQWNDF
jgi:hypothetical protein